MVEFTAPSGRPYLRCGLLSVYPWQGLDKLFQLCGRDDNFSSPSAVGELMAVDALPGCALSNIQLFSSFSHSQQSFHVVSASAVVFFRSHSDIFSLR